MDPCVSQLAELMVSRCLAVQPGWQVSVARRRSPASVEEVARAIARRGAYYLPRINWGPDRFRVDLHWALEAPLELLGGLPPIERYPVEHEERRLRSARRRTSAGSELNPEQRSLLQEPASR